MNILLKYASLGILLILLSLPIILLQRPEAQSQELNGCIRTSDPILKKSFLIQKLGSPDFSIRAYFTPVSNDSLLLYQQVKCGKGELDLAFLSAEGILRKEYIRISDSVDPTYSHPVWAKQFAQRIKEIYQSSKCHYQIPVDQLFSVFSFSNGSNNHYVFQKFKPMNLCRSAEGRSFFFSLDLN